MIYLNIELYRRVSIYLFYFIYLFVYIYMYLCVYVYVHTYIYIIYTQYMYILYIELYRHVWTYTCIYLYVGNNWAQVLHLGEQCVRWEKTAAASRDRHGSVTFRMFLLWCSSWAAPGCIDGVPRPKCQTFWGVRSCRMSDRAAIWLWQQFTTVKVRATLTTTTKSTTFEEIRCLGLVPQLGLLPSWIPTVKSVLKDVASTSCLHIKDGEKGCMVHDGPSRMAWTFFLFFFPGQKWCETGEL